MVTRTAPLLAELNSEPADPRVTLPLTPFAELPDTTPTDPPLSAVAVCPADMRIAPPLPESPDPTFTTIEPPCPPTDWPDSISMLPELPAVPDPVLTRTDPLVADSGDRTSTPPLETCLLAPLSSVNEPPVLISLAPPITRTAPPVPAPLVPAETVTVPALPPSAADEPIFTSPDARPGVDPETNVTLPESPVAEPTPVLRTSAPLAPSLPAGAVSTFTDPLDESVLSPLIIVMLPPWVFSDAPAVNNTSPASAPSVAEPADTRTVPTLSAPASPDDTSISPDGPDSEFPLLRSRFPLD